MFIRKNTLRAQERPHLREGAMTVKNRQLSSLFPGAAAPATAAKARLAAACLVSFLLAPAVALAAPPVLYFSDLDWGPKTGWEGSTVKGAAVTVWGQNLGAGRGSNHITVNGARLSADSDYAEWGAIGPARGLSRITFWLNPAAQDGAGQITVTVDGQTSNPLPFTVMAATIYFVSPSGSNSSNGLYAASHGGLAGPFRDIYMFNPGLDSYHGSGSRNPSGDGQYIVYVRGGAYATLDVDSAFVALRGPYGGPTRRKALIGYPGETPVLDATSASRGVTWEAAYSPYGRVNYLTVAKLRVTNGSEAFGLWGDYNRVIGNHAKDMLQDIWSGVVMVDNSQYSQVHGNFFEHCGFDSYKHNIYIKTHQDYVAGDKSVDHTDVGWNEFADAWAGTDTRGGVIFVSRESGTDGKYTGDTRIHDNYFRDGNMDFIYVGDGTPIGDVWVYNNVFRGGTSSNGGITLYTGTNNAYFYNNTFYQIGPAGLPMIWATGAARAVFKNNIWHSWPGQAFFALETYQGATFDSECDLYYDPDGSTSVPSGAGITVRAAVVGNPQFVNPASNDFHLLGASPAVGVGTAAVGATVARDYDGNPRPQGVSFDVGAFEYTPQVTVTAVTPSSGSGAQQVFRAEYTGTQSYQRLRWVQMLIAADPGGGGQPFCLLHYDVQGNAFWLYSDLLGFFRGPVTPGVASSQLQGSQCALNTADSTVTGSGTSLVLNLVVVFKAAATRNVYMRAMDFNDVDTGWVQRGTWTQAAPAPPMLAVAPASGAGASPVFTLTFQDPSGFTGAPLGWQEFLVAVNSTGGGQPFCFLHYDRAGNGLWMYSSDVGFFLGPVSPGTASNALNSSACSINTAGTTVQNQSGNLVLTVPVTLKGPMSGVKNIYMRTLDALNRDTGWQQKGTWTFP
jgi:hypothetical protein